MPIKVDLWEINPAILIWYLFDEIIKFVGKGSGADVLDFLKHLLSYLVVSWWRN